MYVPERSILFRWSRARLAALAALLIVATTALAEPSREYQLKAAFVYNFAQFVEWPADAFAAPDAPLVVGVVGDDPFDGALEQVLGGKSINSHAIKVMRLPAGADDRDLRGCHVLFIPGNGDHERVLKAVKNTAVLTVGESDKLLHAGGVIRLYVDGNKVRFEISPRAAKASRLSISAKLLKLARIYEG